jgi:hypothetical protein
MTHFEISGRPRHCEAQVRVLNCVLGPRKGGWDMKNKLGIYVGLLIFVGLLAWAGHVSAQKTNINNDRKVWEYKVGVAQINGVPSVQDQLNELGAEGWELVAVENISTPAPPSAVYYLKRAKEKEKE